ncbi:sensor histidine kinase [Micromonospora sp. NBC_00617]|uniref:sensor histidine kinase n=1 Tax=Micromonospora sp. NBC_00617 TaxID=2903587 RepID=UPI0030E21B98
MKFAVSGPPRTAIFDGAVVLFAVIGNMSMAVGPSPVMKAHHGLSLVALLTVSATLLWRRRLPLTVAWLVTIATAVMVLVDQVAPDLLVRPGADRSTLVWAPHAVPFAIYSAIRFADRPVARWIPVAAMAVLVARPWPPTTGRTALQSILLLAVVPVCLALYLGARRRLLQALVDRADQAELLAERARAEERTRLAAEMHDVITHRVSLMVLQAGVLSITTGDRGAREAAENIREVGCQALDELRDMVRILADDEPETTEPDDEPLPDFSPLIEASESVGVPVEVIGEGPSPCTSAVVGRTAYRVVQEALTNIRKHAPGARARIHVRSDQDQVLLSIHNGPPSGTTDTALSGSGSGAGLLGLRQRVELLGGTLNAQPTDDGGFRIDATLPGNAPAHR